MAEQFTFPQSGDNDDAEHFASMIGSSNLADFVETGLNFTVDYGVPEVTVSTGKAFIMTTSETASSSGDTILRTNHAVQVPQQTVSLTDSTTNYIYLEPDFTTDDNAAIAAYTSQQSGDPLLLGTIDTTNDTSSEVNRSPVGEFSQLGVDDDSELFFGGDDDFSIQYNSSTNELELTDETNSTIKQTWDKSGDSHIPNGALGVGVSTVSGGQLEVNGDIRVNVNSAIEDDSGNHHITINNAGSTDMERTVSFPNITGAPTFAGHDHSEGGMTVVPNGGLANSSVSVAGNNVSLGGSTSVAYVDLSDTGSSFPIPNSDLSNSSITINNGVGIDSSGSVSLGGNITLAVGFEDDEDLDFGAGDDFVLRYDSANTQLELESADIDGVGTTGNILRVVDGQQDVDFLSDISFPNITGAPSFSGHDHTSGGMTAIPNNGLSNSSITINNGVGIDGGTGSISLGGSTTLTVGFEDDEALDFGAGDDFSFRYDSANTQLELESADIDGVGTTGNILRVAAGQQDAEFLSDISFPNITGAPSFSGHDHSEGGMTTVPNTGLTNSSITVAGNAVSLGGSTAIDHADISNTGPNQHHNQSHDNTDHSTNMIEDATGDAHEPHEIQLNGTDGNGVINFKT